MRVEQDVPLKLTLTLSFVLLLMGIAYGQTISVPPLVNYQGKLTDASGAPLATREYTISISIFRQPEDVTEVWGPQVFDGQGGTGHGPKTPVVQGFFNVVLGPKDTAERDIAMAFSTKDAYLEVTVEGGTPITPRQQILATPYVMKSDDGNSPGIVVAFPGDIVPTGWLLCSGTPLSKTQYPRLWDAIGTAWGDGTKNPDGSASTGTDFNLPNLQGRFLRGADKRTSGGDDPEAPRSVGSLQEDTFRSHTHALSKKFLYYRAGSRTLGEAPDNYWMTWGNIPATGNTGDINETRPKNAAVNYIIKY